MLQATIVIIPLILHYFRGMYTECSAWDPSKNALARSSKKRSKIMWDLVGFCKNLAGILLQDFCKKKINPVLLIYC